MPFFVNLFANEEQHLTGYFVLFIVAALFNGFNVRDDGFAIFAGLNENKDLLKYSDYYNRAGIARKLRRSFRWPRSSGLEKCSAVFRLESRLDCSCSAGMYHDSGRYGQKLCVNKYR